MISILLIIETQVSQCGSPVLTVAIIPQNTNQNALLNEQPNYKNRLHPLNAVTRGYPNDGNR